MREQEEWEVPEERRRETQRVKRVACSHRTCSPVERLRPGFPSLGWEKLSGRHVRGGRRIRGFTPIARTYMTRSIREGGEWGGGEREHHLIVWNAVNDSRVIGRNAKVASHACVRLSFFDSPLSPRVALCPFRESWAKKSQFSWE